jgi:hypothetical protein
MTLENRDVHIEAEDLRAEGTTLPMHRNILMGEPMFMEFIEFIEKRDGVEIEVDYGDRSFRSEFFYQPTLYVSGEDDDDSVGQ